MLILNERERKMLKKIEVIIREGKLNDVKDALKEMGIVGLNLFEIRGHGRGGGHHPDGPYRQLPGGFAAQDPDKHHLERT